MAGLAFFGEILQLSPVNRLVTINLPFAMEDLNDRLARLRRETNAQGVLIANLKRSPLLQMPEVSPEVKKQKLDEIERQEQLYNRNLFLIKELENQLQTS